MSVVFSFLSFINGKIKQRICSQSGGHFGYSLLTASLGSTSLLRLFTYFSSLLLETISQRMAEFMKKLVILPELVPRALWKLKKYRCMQYHWEKFVDPLSPTAFFSNPARIFLLLNAWSLPIITPVSVALSLDKSTVILFSLEESK